MLANGVVGHEMPKVWILQFSFLYLFCFPILCILPNCYLSWSFIQLSYLFFAHHNTVRTYAICFNNAILFSYSINIWSNGKCYETRNDVAARIITETVWVYSIFSESYVHSLKCKNLPKTIPDEKQLDYIKPKIGIMYQRKLNLPIIRHLNDQTEHLYSDTERRLSKIWKRMKNSNASVCKQSRWRRLWASILLLLLTTKFRRCGLKSFLLNTVTTDA